MNVSNCCQARCAVDNGHFVCTLCGKVGGVHLETTVTTYNNLGQFYLVKPYTRKGRFEKKILQLLQCRLNFNLDDDLLFFLKTRKIKTPEDLHEEIGMYPTKGRRPYNKIVYYWVALGFKQPTCTERDSRLLKREFDNIFFAWERLGFLRPSFPYAYLFRKIVNRVNSPYSDGLRFMTRFVRVLRCNKRRERYDDMFKKCSEFNYKEVSYMPSPVYPKNEILSREKVWNPKRISPYDVPNVYRSMDEINAAKKRGDFDIAKTFHIAKNGQIYCLSYGDPHVVSKKREPIQMQKLSLSDNK